VDASDRLFSFSYVSLQLLKALSQSEQHSIDHTTYSDKLPFYSSNLP